MSRYPSCVLKFSNYEFIKLKQIPVIIVQEYITCNICFYILKGKVTKYPSVFSQSPRTNTRSVEPSVLLSGLYPWIISSFLTNLYISHLLKFSWIKNALINRSGNLFYVMSNFVVDFLNVHKGEHWRTFWGNYKLGQKMDLINALCVCVAWVKTKLSFIKMS